MESFFSGKSVIVLENGEPNLKNLKKLRFTVDRLETRLRQNGVSSMKDVKTGTIEVSGQIGYELKDDKRRFYNHNERNITIKSINERLPKHTEK